MRLLLPVLLALVLVPAALAVDPRVQTISGVVTANSGSSLTVSTTGHSLTCLVSGPKAQVAIAHWGTGARATMECKQVGTALLLARLSRNDTKDPKVGGGDTTTPATTATQQAIGVVTALSSDAVTVTAASGDALRCRITQAADSSAAARKLTLGAHAGIVCRADGGSFVLSGATSG
jgi:hypothetical protein